jgi:hypothetical protein
VNTGVGVVLSTEDGAWDPFLAATAADARDNLYQIRLNVNYTNEAGTAGAALRFRATGAETSPSFPFAYGWVSAFDKVLTVKGGLVDDGVWNTTGYVLAADQTEGLGVLAKLTPISGLDIGAGAYLGSAASSAIATGGVDLDTAKYTFNLGYALPDLVKIVATYRTKSGTSLSSRALVGLELKAVPNLKAILEVELDNLQDFTTQEGDKDAWGKTVGSQAVTDADGKVTTPAGPTPTAASGKINVYETVQYDLGSLSVGLFAIEWLSQAEGADLAFYANPWVSYALGSVVPRLDFGYGSAAQAGFNNDTTNPLRWHRQNYAPTYKKDVSVISIRPSVKFNIDSKTYVEIGDLIDIDGNKNKEATWGDDSRISNVFYVDFKWVF